MFGFGFLEILVILTVVLLVLGPDKLPEFTRTLGKLSYQLRSTADEFRREISFSSLGMDESELRKELEDLRRLPDDCPEDAKADEQERLASDADSTDAPPPLDQQMLDAPRTSEDETTDTKK